MSTKSTTKSLKVILSFSEKNTPEWFRYLSAVDSGFVRAELLRKHLKAPGAVQIWQDGEQPPAIQILPAPTIKPPAVAAQPAAKANPPDQGGTLADSFTNASGGVTW